MKIRCISVKKRRFLLYFYAIFPNGEIIEVYGLLDQVSKVNLIDAQDAEKLQLKGKTRTTQFRTFHDEDPVLQVKEVAFTVTSLDGCAFFQLEGFYAVP